MTKKFDMKLVIKVFSVTYSFIPHMIQELENPVILVHEKKISSLNSIIPVLELVVQVSHNHLFHAIFKCFLSFIHAYFLNVPILTKLYFSGSKTIADCGRGCGE